MLPLLRYATQHLSWYHKLPCPELSATPELEHEPMRILTQIMMHTFNPLFPKRTYGILGPGFECPNSVGTVRPWNALSIMIKGGEIY